MFINSDEGDTLWLTLQWAIVGNLTQNLFCESLPIVLPQSGNTLLFNPMCLANGRL